MGGSGGMCVWVWRMLRNGGESDVLLLFGFACCVFVNVPHRDKTPRMRGVVKRYCTTVTTSTIIIKIVTHYHHSIPTQRPFASSPSALCIIIIASSCSAARYLQHHIESAYTISIETRDANAYVLSLLPRGELLGDTDAAICCGGENPFIWYILRSASSRPSC